jgi:hypothetical protein
MALALEAVFVALAMPLLDMRRHPGRKSGGVLHESLSEHT